MLENKPFLKKNLAMLTNKSITKNVKKKMSLNSEFYSWDKSSVSLLLMTAGLKTISNTNWIFPNSVPYNHKSSIIDCTFLNEKYNRCGQTLFGFVQAYSSQIEL